MAACNQNLSVECPRLHQPRLSCQQFLLLPLAYETIISIITYLCKRQVFSHIRHNGIRHDYRQLPTIATSPLTTPPKNTERKYTGIRIPANPIKYLSTLPHPPATNIKTALVISRHQDTLSRTIIRQPPNDRLWPDRCGGFVFRPAKTRLNRTNAKIKLFAKIAQYRNQISTLLGVSPRKFLLGHLNNS